MRFWKGELIMATVTIQKRKRKKGIRYLVSYKVPLTGEKKHYKTFQKYREAQLVANDLRAMIDSGKLPEPKRTKLNPLTFNQVSISLIQEWEKRHNRGELAQKTITGYRDWLKIVNRIFGDRLLCLLKADEIQLLQDDVAKRLTNVTANKYLSVIKKVFVHGKSLKAVIHDPSEAIPYLSEKDHRRNRFLLPYELEKLVRAAQKTRAKFYIPAIIFLGAEHGASKQEILDLEWAKIDFYFKGIGLINLFRTKNRKERTEFLMPRTKQALLKWKDHLEWMRHRRQITHIKSDRVFCRLDGTPKKCFNNAWWHALKVAGIKDFHFHDLRHTFCSNLLLSGAGLKDAKEMIGHSDISMTDRYSHLTPQRHQMNQQNLANHYMNSGSTSGVDKR
jgi:integrase